MKRDAASDGVSVRPGLTIPAVELDARATRSGGPGGQHVNKTSTRVELIWRLPASRVITDAERRLITDRLAGRLDAEGNVRVAASDTRSQTRNRALAETRLAALVRRALAVPKPRKATRPTRASVERRLVDKQRRSARKRDRRHPPDD